MTRREDGRLGRARRRRSLLLVALAAAAAALLGPAASALVQPPSSTAAAYSYAVAQSPDVVVAGGLDGRVYAVNAWSGEVLWSFDSGGPMVDSSQCLGVHQSPEMPPSYHSAAARPREHEHEREHAHARAPDHAEADVDADGSVRVAASDKQVEDRSVMQHQTASTQAMAASAAFMSQLVPSYDGRLYHFSKSKVKELGMTMADIVNVNGPVRVAVDPTTSGDVKGPSVEGSAVADILLFGEKKLEMFTLDAVSGFRRPYSSTAAASTVWSSEILFGRSEFTTRAVHSRNASSARCFKISEFFLDFAQQAHCSVGDGGHNMAPEILVMPKDPNSALDDEGSTIVAFDPWTNEQLWEFEVPDFDVLAVYGVSTARGATFYKWKVDGPSSTATKQVLRPAHVESSRVDHNHKIEANSEHASATNAQVEHEKQLLQADKQLVQVVPRTWDTMESRFRLRLLGDNYFLESSEDDGAVNHDIGQVSHGSPPTFHGRQPDDARDFHEDMGARRRRRIFWEPIVNDGKRGVFITYTHVGAMLLGVTTCGMLLAWGCYVKGLSASLAQSAIKSMDQSQFFASHVHRLTIQRPGEEDIVISSVISRSLMVNTLGVNGQVPLLENGEPVSVLSTEVSANVDPATEGMLMEKFSRLAANEAAAILLGGGNAGAKHKLLEADPDADSNATTATSISSSSSLTDMIVRGISTSSSTLQVSNHGSARASSRLALPYAEDKYEMNDNLSDVYEVKMLSASEEAEFLSPNVDNVFDDDRFELADSDDEMFPGGEESVGTVNAAKSISSSGDSTTGSCSSNSSSGSSQAMSKSNDRAGLLVEEREDETTDEKSSEEKSSAQESSESSESSSSESGSSPNEAEVLFPFVCQSRFVNEFEELSAIGKGGFGQVMLAENRLDGRKYAIKRVGLNLKNQTSKTLQKFLREVKILALLDHPNIVRYYQAWLEKVEESAKRLSVAPSSVASVTSSFGGLANAKNYSTSNLLAPISELEFSGNQRQLETFYSNGSMISDNDDDGFEWERGSSSGVEDANGWKEEDLVVQNKPRTRNVPSRVPSSRSPSDLGSEDDSSFNAAEKCDHWLYIQMQYCAGRNLADYLAVPTRPMELSRMLKIFVQIASALAHVHSCGLIHRDLKPANIFVADVERDEIKLGDFGLSRYAANVNNLNASATLDDSQQGPPSSGGLRETPLSMSVWSNMSESNEVTAGVGTYLYASPEQVAGKKYNAKTDVYSLGMILFELCHERFGTTMERYITLRDARDSKFPADLRAAKRCPEILEMLRKLLSHDPSTRPTADEVVQWGQMMYETSLAQKAMDVVRSPRNLDIARATGGAYPFVPGIEHLMAGGGSVEVVATTTFSLKVEAVMEHSSGDEGGERRLPNHNLLKQVCDVIAGVSNGKVEIKKCGLHMQSEGVTILEFELDPQAALAEAPGSDVEGTVVMAIEALAGVQIVHRVSKID